MGRGTKSQSRPIGRRCSFGVEPGPPAHARLSPTVADAPGPRRCLRQPARSASIGRRRTGPGNTSRPSAHTPSCATWLKSSLASGSGHDSSENSPLAPALRGDGGGLVPISRPQVPSSAILLQRAALRRAPAVDTSQHDSLPAPDRLSHVGTDASSHPQWVPIAAQARQSRWSVHQVAPSYCSSGVAAHLPVPAACLWRVGVVQLDHGRRELAPMRSAAKPEP